MLDVSLENWKATVIELKQETRIETTKIKILLWILFKP